MNLKRFISGCCLLAASLLLSPFAGHAEPDFSKVPARPAPAWLRDGVVYEIFTRNFSASGKFTAVTARLDELKDLGVDILWLMPIHPIGEAARKGPVGSPYAIKDYYAIDPAHGTPEEFKQLITAAHQSGMKVIMDVVANHTAWDSVMMAHPGTGSPTSAWTASAATSPTWCPPVSGRKPAPRSPKPSPTS
ncbi:MAG: alpha-amylase family glycosyl hydrolase [Verrucomicrobia bacterium]|nr:alpha-amylase family glycosyl hydrolase [Verrucomicrobiota bacterium]